MSFSGGTPWSAWDEARAFNDPVVILLKMRDLGLRNRALLPGIFYFRFESRLCRGGRRRSDRAG